MTDIKAAGRPTGRPHTGGKTPSKQSYTCMREGCGKEFREVPSNRPWATAYCSKRCAALAREKILGHNPAIVAKCAMEGCNVEVKRYASRTVSQTSKDFTGNVFCCCDHYLRWRHSKK